MKKAFPVAALMAAGVVLASFAVPVQKSDVDISVREKKIIDLTLQGLTLIFDLDVNNALSVPQFLAKYDFRVVIGETEYIDLRAELDEPIRIEPRSSALIALPVKITYEYLFQAVPEARTKDLTAFFLTGGIVFRDEKKKEKRVPIAFSGDFPIYRGLEIRLLPIETKDLTIGGADLVFKAALQNPNGFSFGIERLTYKLEIVGKTVSEGTVGRGDVVEGRGEKIFSIPLLLDFFDAGRVLYDGLAQPPVAARFSGEVEISTTWGNFTIPLEKSDKIAVQRSS